MAYARAVAVADNLTKKKEEDKKHQEEQAKAMEKEAERWRLRLSSWHLSSGGKPHYIAQNAVQRGTTVFIGTRGATITDRDKPPVQLMYPQGHIAPQRQPCVAPPALTTPMPLFDFPLPMLQPPPSLTGMTPTPSGGQNLASSGPPEISSAPFDVGHADSDRVSPVVRIELQNVGVHPPHSAACSITSNATERWRDCDACRPAAVPADPPMQTGASAVRAPLGSDLPSAALMLYVLPAGRFRPPRRRSISTRPSTT